MLNFKSQFVRKDWLEDLEEDWKSSRMDTLLCRTCAPFVLTVHKHNWIQFVLICKVHFKESSISVRPIDQHTQIVPKHYENNPPLNFHGGLGSAFCRDVASNPSRTTDI